jgi:hypothetical protein
MNLSLSVINQMTVRTVFCWTFWIKVCQYF